MPENCFSATLNSPIFLTRNGNFNSGSKKVLYKFHPSQFPTYMHGVLKSFPICIVIAFFLFPLYILSDDRKDIELIIDGYFKSWSSADFNTYGNFFLPSATIYFREKNGRTSGESLSSFLANQRLSQTHTELMNEIPTSKKIDIGKELSFARVSWKLSGRGRTNTGMDYFVFLKTQEGWKIHYLLFSYD